MAREGKTKKPKKGIRYIAQKLRKYYQMLKHLIKNYQFLINGIQIPLKAADPIHPLPYPGSEIFLVCYQARDACLIPDYVWGQHSFLVKEGGRPG